MRQAGLSNIAQQRNDVLGEGGQTLAVMGDNELCLSVLYVPDTKMDHLDRAMNEILDRHAPGSIPKILYVDCACCNGKLGGTYGCWGTLETTI